MCYLCCFPILAFNTVSLAFTRRLIQPWNMEQGQLLICTQGPHYSCTSKNQGQTLVQSNLLGDSFNKLKFWRVPDNSGQVEGLYLCMWIHRHCSRHDRCRCSFLKCFCRQHSYHIHSLHCTHLYLQMDAVALNCENKPCSYQSMWIHWLGNQYDRCRWSSLEYLCSQHWHHTYCFCFYTH